MATLHPPYHPATILGQDVRFWASKMIDRMTGMGALQSASQLRERLLRKAGTIEKPGALRARGVDVTMLTCD